jgi:PAS domain S-box-containing protein
MNDRDRNMTELREELERLRRRIAELESRKTGDRRSEALRANEKRYQLLLDTMIHGVQENDCSGVITYSNRAHHRIMGYEHGELVGKAIWQLLPSGDEQDALREYLAYLVKQQPKPAPYLTACRKKDGSLVDLQIDWDYQRDDAGRLKGFISVITDITERKQAEANVRNAARLYAFLSQINQAIVRTRDRDELFRTICRVAVEFGQFRMAWVGMIDEATGIVLPVVHTGQEEGYLNVLSIRISDETTGKGPTGSALRGGALTICDDIATDLRMLPWREEALKRGYRSSAAIPFRQKEKVIGSLNLYAAEPGFFAEDERKLLTEIGVNISFALDTMESEKERKRIEVALRESEERLNYMMSNSPSVIYTCRPSGDFGATFVSENVVHQLGYEASAFIADPGFWAAHIHLDDKQRVFDGLSALFAEGSHTHEYRFLHKDGAWRWMHDELRLIRNAAGEPVEILGSWVDITDRKQAEDALGESERKYRTLFDSATDAIFILDLNGNILDINRTAHARLGYTKREMLSMHVSRLDPPEFAVRVSERLTQVSRSGVAVFESAHLRKDGSVMPVEINSRLLEYEGRQEYFSIVRDITDRKRAEEALRESEERFRTLLARVDSVAVQGFGPDGVVHYWNKASERLYGYSAEEAQGRNILDLIVSPEARGPIANAITQMAESGSPLPSSEASLLRKDGSRVTVYASYAVVNMPGRAPELYCIDIDLTDRKRAEQERLELERRLLYAQKLESLGILAGGIAHDFNNLLMAVLGNLDLALRKVSPVSPARANIEQSAQAARRATDLTRQMLAYSGKGRFIVKPMDLSELVEENTHLFRASVARTATLDVRLGRSLPSIEADVGQVQQVIMNLITNAAEAIGDSSGGIIITTGMQECDAQCLKQSRLEDVPPAGRFVYLDVSDTGCGMDEQTQQRLFDPFFSTKAPGRGLGMSAILGIVRGHGGAIFVESSPGRGTSVRILFPAPEEARTENEAVNNTRAAEAGAPAMSGTVLVVDDEEIVRMVCKEMVETMGLQVLTASDGREAVDLFTSHADSISHVILDLSMPNMDGMAAFTELVRIKPSVKVILSSGYDEQESLQRLSGPGPAGFIQKPYSLQSLRDALEKAGASGA